MFFVFIREMVGEVGDGNSSPERYYELAVRNTLSACSTLSSRAQALFEMQRGAAFSKLL